MGQRQGKGTGQQGERGTRLSRAWASPWVWRAKALRRSRGSIRERSGRRNRGGWRSDQLLIRPHRISSWGRRWPLPCICCAVRVAPASPRWIGRWPRRPTPWSSGHRCKRSEMEPAPDPGVAAIQRERAVPWARTYLAGHQVPPSVVRGCPPGRGDPITEHRCHTPRVGFRAD